MTTTQVVVVGSGVAGAWVARRLAQRGIDTVVVNGPAAPVSRQWAACVLNTRLLENPATALADTSGTQLPALREAVELHLEHEFAELSRLVELMPHHDFLIPAHEIGVPRLGGGDTVVGAVLAEFTGRVVDARVTDLVVHDGICVGVRTDRGPIAANHVVLATGGLCGIFGDGVTENTGGLLGAYLRHGGTLANLEMFNRFALGDRTRRRPLYPFDLAGARLLCDGEPVELAGGDLELFRDYWTANLGVPHTAELAAGTVELGPVRGFSAGGAAGGIENLHAVGEARYDLAVDTLVGLPWLVFLVTSGLLAERLDPGGKPAEIADGPVSAPLDPVLLSEVRRRLTECHDHLGTAAAKQDFLDWAWKTRDTSTGADADLLLLAEACTASALARTESRGFFLRADFPDEDPAFAGKHTEAIFDHHSGRVEVRLT